MVISLYSNQRQTLPCTNYISHDCNQQEIHSKKYSRTEEYFLKLGLE